MTSLTISIPSTMQRGTHTSNYGKNFSEWLKNLVSPTVSVVGDKNEIVNALITSQSFINYIEDTGKEFIEDHNNLRKYPRFNEKDWK